MNKIKTFLVVLSVTIGLSTYVSKSEAATRASHYQNDRDVNYQTFYDELSPDGRWIMDDQYGYVWSPNAGPDFMPYNSNGHWVYTDIGWTWASDYRWGWATFHYGRWKLDNYYGWVWVPGYEWAPAWVAWSSSSDYYGWAPLEPGWNVNVSFNIGRIPSAYWMFVPHRYITYSSWNRYCAPRRNNVTIINHVTVIHNTNVYNNTRFVCGPRAEEYRRHTGYAVRPVAVRESSRPRPVNVQEGSLCIYRPRVNGKGDNYKPTNIVTRPRTDNVSNNDPRRGNNGNHYGNEPNRPGNGNQNGDSQPGPQRRPDSDNSRYTDRSNQPDRPNADRGELKPREDKGGVQAPENPGSNGRYADRGNQPDRPNVGESRPQYVPQGNPSTDRPREDKVVQAPENRGNNNGRPNNVDRSEPRPQYVPRENQTNDRPNRERRTEQPQGETRPVRTVSSTSNSERRERPSSSNASSERSRSNNSSGSNESHGRSRSRN